MNAPKNREKFLRDSGSFNHGISLIESVSIDQHLIIWNKVEFKGQVYLGDGASL